MNTRFLMTVSAITMGFAGLICSFLPDELVRFSGFGDSYYFTLLFQILGATYLGFAALNWMAKGGLIGGIYSKPVAIGNFMHFTVGGLAILKMFLKLQDTKLLTLFVVYAIFAFCFGIVTFGGPFLKK